MNTDKKNMLLDKICTQFGSLQNQHPPMRVDWMALLGWNLLFERDYLDDVCLVYLHVENSIGIADKNRKGYTPTPCVICDGVNGEDVVNWFNENILGLTYEQAQKIILSTMRR